MSKVRVPLYKTPGKAITIDTEAVTPTQAKAMVKAATRVQTRMGQADPTSTAFYDATSNVTGSLTNPVETIPTNPDGTGGDFSSANGVFEIWKNDTDVTGSGPVYSVSSATTGLSITIDAATGAYSVSAMTVDSGSAILQADYLGVTVKETFRIEKNLKGQDVKLVASDYSFDFSSGSLIAGQSDITLTASIVNLTGSVAWSTIPAGVTLTGTGNTRTLTGANFASAGTREVQIRATLGGITDVVNIVKLTTTSTTNLTPGAHGGQNLFPDPGATNANFYSIPGTGAATLDGSGGVVSPTLAASTSWTSFALDGTGANLIYQGPELFAGQFVTITGKIKAVTSTGTGAVGLECRDASGAVVSGGFLTFGNFAGGTHTLTTTLPLNTVSILPYLAANGGASGGSATISNFAIRLGTQTLSDPGGARLGDGRNLFALNTGGYATSYALSGVWIESYNSSDNTYTVTEGASVYRIGSAQVSFNSWSSPHLSPSTKYYFAAQNADYSGGAVSLVYSTSVKNMMNAENLFYLGAYTTGASGGVGGGGGGGPICVDAAMYLSRNFRAQRAVENTRLTYATGFNIKGFCRATSVHPRTGPCVRLVAQNGAACIWSRGTGFEQPDGSTVLAEDMEGKPVLTTRGASIIERVEDVGSRPVMTITTDPPGMSYGAGEDAENLMIGHNTICP